MFVSFGMVVPHCLDQDFCPLIIRCMYILLVFSGEFGLSYKKLIGQLKWCVCVCVFCLISGV